MKELYRRGNLGHLTARRKFNRWALVAVLVTAALGGAVAALVYDIKKSNQGARAPVSKTTVETLTFDRQYHRTPYFQFADSGNWRLASSEGTPTKFIFRKYLGQSEVVQHQLIVYINQEPSRLDLTATRVLPVSLKRGSGFESSSVSRHCGESYEEGALRRVQLRQLNQSVLLCDPDTSQYKVIFGERGGDYKITMQRPGGGTANYLIMYQDSRLSPSAETVLQIARTFQAL